VLGHVGAQWNDGKKKRQGRHAVLGAPSEVTLNQHLFRGEEFRGNGAESKSILSNRQQDQGKNTT